ncbi:CMGC/GSK protein kinase [Microbotryum lychnidis-dioicae p1A1 Lamole]|uniref:CMGC/GSK protein kinase n=1 Tax=Microbotryum lychnidis-dioicae (strain p1A1 Lamole / MvSl-1064) TaxID=683840 RepID=U5GZH2_USTV1|nr:CMGC/GSK protein kinase [Microbotryum lychnidis-dioicae p1A1 Lamole]|eukprot:KDE09254.1 CMGC/GSK protein kinase [Microbotryum lychnidis-dioicae p1A1 Lamole]
MSEPSVHSPVTAIPGQKIDPTRVYTIEATSVQTGQKTRLQYTDCKISGHGSFGVVVAARLIDGDVGRVALKRTKQDRRFKNRELQIMKITRHPNIIRLLYWYYEPSGKPEEVYLNLVLDYEPETIFRTYRIWTKQQLRFPEFLIKVHMFQLCRAVSYLHSMGICHRDLKPHNILVDPRTCKTTLIDFGSAKVLREGEANVSYTCSRYYRAAELIFGATMYTHQLGSTSYPDTIDMWSIGCIFAELLQGSVFFPGSSGVDQLVEIIKVLGTPSPDQIKAMVPNYHDRGLPHIKPTPFSKLLPRASPEAIDLLQNLIVFDPSQRLSAAELLAHAFFDEIKHPGPSGTGPVLPGGERMPPMFNFSHHELSIRPDLVNRIIPSYARREIYIQHGIDLSKSWQPIDLRTVRVDDIID